MRFLTSLIVVLFSLFCIEAVVSAQVVDLQSGQTNVTLDFPTLDSAASLTFSSVSGDVIVPGTTIGSVAFPINSRTAASLPTTFSYDPSDFLGTFSGNIEHKGSVLFNADTVEVGDFRISYDVMRVGTLSGAGTGFYVESTTGIAAILFDVVDIGTLNTTTDNLVIGASLAVSPEFGGFLLTNNLSTSNLQGAVVGSALVSGVVPEPGTGVMILTAVLGLGLLNRRRR